jgi:hypothetical protein
MLRVFRNFDGSEILIIATASISGRQHHISVLSEPFRYSSREEETCLVKERYGMGVAMHKVIASVVGIAAVVVGAVAIARSSTGTNTSSFPKTRAVAATCQKIEWPYGCAWHPANDSRTKHLSARKEKHSRLFMSFFN